MNTPATVPVASQGQDLEKLYDKLMTDRTSFLDRGRKCATLTLPYLMPPEGFRGNASLPTPMQSVGAQGVNNLANQLLSSLFPPNTPFFRMVVDDATIRELTQDDKARAAIEEKLNEVERMIHVRIGARLQRASLLYLLKLLIVSGNALLVLRKEGLRIHRLDNYVIQRDGSGNLLKSIVREEVSPDVLPESLQEKLKEDNAEGHQEAIREGDVVIMTYYYRDGDRMRTYQTVRGHRVEGSEGQWPLEKAPVIAMRWSWQDAEDYGRGYVEEYLGDFIAAENLSKAIREAAAAAAKVVIVVNPNGLTRESDVTEAENLEVITGKVEDVGILQLNKAADMQVAKSVLDEIVRRLSQAFLMHLGVRRDAERVTAEETRMVVAALENSLGGTYALFAQELQMPLVRIVKAELELEKRIPKIPTDSKGKSVVEPVITTGVEALGRGEDFSRYNTFVTAILQALGPDVALKYINVSDFIKRAGTSLNLDMDGLVKTNEDIQREAQEAQQAQQEMMTQQTMGKMAEKAAGPAAQAMMAQGEQNA